MPFSRLVLASSSPRRVDMLRSMGLAFDAVPADVPEDAEGLPAERVRALSLRKAKAVALLCPDALVIGADTLVSCEGETLGKPRDEADAARMLRLLSGRWHSVFTGLTLLDAATGVAETEAAVTHVQFVSLTDADIAWYIATGEPMDKAGSYGAQGYARGFIEAMDGAFDTVIGLPTARVKALLHKFGWPAPWEAARSLGQESLSGISGMEGFDRA